MSEKDKTNVKKLSKRILAGFRKGKKLNSIKEQAGTNESLLDTTVNCSQESLDVSASLPQESDVSFSTQLKKIQPGSSTLSPRRKFFHRKKSSVTSLPLSANDSDITPNFASPRRLRLPQAGQISKSSSTDSGIDCSQLLSSEIGSPEQLAILSRREAERLRLERKLAQNESILEPLTEVDRSSGEEGDCGVSREDVASKVAESKGNGDSQQALQTKGQVVTLSGTKSKTENLEENKNNGATSDTTFHNLVLESKLLENNDSNGNIQRDLLPTIETNDDLSLHTSLKAMSSSKYSREKLNMSVNLSGTERNSEPDLLNITSIPSKNKLENSFAKSKSVKRSVSDVGKGILGHFRHKRKGNESMCKDDSLAHNHSRVHETKKFLSSKLKRISIRRKKKSKDDSNSVHIVELPDNPNKETNLTLEHMGLDMTNSDSKHAKKLAKRKYLSKSVIETSDSNKEAQERRKSTPNFHESIHDLTNSICEMTNALSVGQSSAESLPCICDCEKKKSKCCEKRRTPPDGAFSSDVEVNHENHSRVFEVCSAPDESDQDVSQTLDASIASTAVLTSERGTQEKQYHSHEEIRKQQSQTACNFDDLDLADTTTDTDDSEWEVDSQCSCEDDCQCYMEECDDPKCLECHMQAASNTEDSDCDNTNVEETLDNPPLVCRKLMNVRVDELDAVNKTSSSSSTSLPSSEKQSSPEEDLSFNLDNSFSVSFKEIDFENGDVMYVEDCDNSFPFKTAEECNNMANVDNMAPRFTALSETPGSSPQMSGNGSLDTTPTPLNLSDHSSFTNISFDEAKKKDGTEEPSPKTQLERSMLRTYSKTNKKRTPLNESVLNGSYTHMINSSNNSSKTQSSHSVNINQNNVSFNSRDYYSINKDTNVQARLSRLKYALPPLTDNWQSCFKKNSDLPQRLNQSFNSFEFQNQRKHEQNISKDYLNSNYFKDRGSQQRLLNRSMPEMDAFDLSMGPAYSQSSAKQMLQNCEQGQFIRGSRLSQSFNASLGPSSLNQSHNASYSIDDSFAKPVLSQSMCEGFNSNQPKGNYSHHSARLNRSLIDMDSLQRRPLVNNPKSDPNLNSTFPNVRMPDGRPQYGDPNLSLNYSQFNNSLSSTPPLDLSMSRQQVEERKARIANRSRRWLNRHVGQVYSPAKRVLHKNRGLTETDLCKQILDLYVSDAEESGYEPGTGTDTSFDASVLVERQLNVEDSILQYGTYVAPRNVVRETNVDDFTTTTVKTCYSGEARTRKLQSGHGHNVSLRGEDRRRAAEEELRRLERSFGRPVDLEKPARSKSQNTSLNSTLPDCGPERSFGRTLDKEKTVRSKSQSTSLNSTLLDCGPEMSFGRTLDKEKPVRSKSQSTSLNSTLPEESFLVESAEEDEVVAGHARFSKLKQSSGRSALKDRTNTSSTPEDPAHSVPRSKRSKSELSGKSKREKQRTNISEKSFDQLTMLHTVHNGQRKVRCLTLDESLSVIKHYPPPKEASRISWGQTLDEMDLYRHTPRKTPVKTRPILLQKDKNFPYDDDTPSPIVLTKMRKPKSFAKKYKNWPWS